MSEFTVTFTEGDISKVFPDSVSFKILDNGVLVIADGDEVRRIAPHAWREVRGGGVRGGQGGAGTIEVF